MQTIDYKTTIITTAISLLERDGFHTFTIKKVAKKLKCDEKDVLIVFPNSNTLIQAALEHSLFVGFNDNLEQCHKDYPNTHDFLTHLFSETITGGLRYPKIIKSHFYTTFVLGKKRSLCIKYVHHFIDKTWKVIEPHLETPKREAAKNRLNQAFASLLFVIVFPQVFTPIEVKTWAQDLASTVAEV